MQYHASLITADGAYHCPVGSIMAIFKIHIIIHSKTYTAGEEIIGWEFVH